MEVEGPRTRQRLTASTAIPCTMYGKRYTGTQSDPHKFSTISETSMYYSPKKTLTMTDVVTKNYKARSAAGEIINNPMDRLEVIETFPQPAFFHRSYVGIEKVGGVDTYQRDWWSGKWPMQPSELGPFLLSNDYEPGLSASIQSLIDQAVAQAHANASSAEISALMIAAEGRETVASIVDILMRALRIIRAVKKNDLRFLKKQFSPKEMSDRYMEARYALRPLMYDVKGVIEAWNKSTSRLAERQTVRGFTAHEWNYSDEWIGTAAYSVRRVKRTLFLSAGVRSGVLCDVELSKLSVWGFDTVLQTALEVIPFSFIVGWFFNVAQTLASFVPNAGVRKLASWATVTTIAASENRLTHIYNSGVPAPPLIDNSFSWSGDKSITYLRKYRIVSPERSLYPRFVVNLDSLKLLDLTKILSQFVKIR